MHEHGTSGGHTGARGEAMEHSPQDESVYACPMHPEVRQGEPGDCPKCGMKLVPQETKAPKAEEKPGGEQAVYACPMHPEVRQGEPGKCPKCGMKLEPQKPGAGTTHDHGGHR